MNRQPNNSGFTLIELLAAMAIMATIVSMVYGSYAATSQSLDMHSSRLACSQRASLVLRLMARQIRCAYAPTTEPNTADSSDVEIRRSETQVDSLQRGLASRVQFDRLSSAFHGNAQDPRGEILSFATTAGLGTGSGTSRGPSQMRYRFDSITGILSIDSRPCEDRLRREDHSESWRPIMRNVTGVDIEFHDGRQWQQNWDGKQRRDLPRAMRIAIRTEDEKGRPYRFETTIPILSRTAWARSQREPRSRGGKP